LNPDKDEFHGFHRHIMFENGRKHGRSGGLIRLYILHSLTQEPKTGYDLIKEMSEKTEGLWVPSKGTLYPMLKKMEEEELIRISETGARSKNIYEITDDGKNLLEKIIQHKKSAEEKMYVFRGIVLEIFGKNLAVSGKTLFEIRHVLENIPPEKKIEAAAITEKCLKDLRELEQDESSNS